MYTMDKDSRAAIIRMIDNRTDYVLKKVTIHRDGTITAKRDVNKTFGGPKTVRCIVGHVTDYPLYELAFFGGTSLPYRRWHLSKDSAVCEAQRVLARISERGAHPAVISGWGLYRDDEYSVR